MLPPCDVLATNGLLKSSNEGDNVLIASKAVLPQLQQVQPPPPTLDIADIGLRPIQQGRQLGLLQPGLAADLDQHLQQRLVFGLVDRFWRHCGVWKYRPHLPYIWFFGIRKTDM